jgi:hypothetical protein
MAGWQRAGCPPAFHGLEGPRSSERGAGLFGLGLEAGGVEALSVQVAAMPRREWGGQESRGFARQAKPIRAPFGAIRGLLDGA